MAIDPAPDNIDLVNDKSVSLPHVPGFDWEVKRTIQPLLPGTRYSFRVRAYNSFNVFSSWSEALEFTTPYDDGVPSKITGLHGSYETGDVVLFWTAPTQTTEGKACNNISHYDIMLDFTDAFNVTQASVVYQSVLPSFTLPLAMQINDIGTPWPNVIATVEAVTTSETRSEPASLGLGNSVPPIEDFDSLSPSTAGIQVAMHMSILVLDFDHFVLESSADIGGPYTQIYSGSSNIFFDVTTESEIKWYRYKVVDKLGQSSLYSDVRSTESLDPGGAALTTEQVQDIVGSLLYAGDNITLDYDDVANSLTISAADGLTLEEMQDAVAAMLVAGTNVTLTYNDAAGTLTVDATGGGGAADSYVTVVGDDTSTDIIVIHSLGTENFVYNMYDYITGESVPNEQVTIIDENSIEINFGSAPALLSRKIVIVAADPVIDLSLYPLEDLYPLETLYPAG